MERVLMYYGLKFVTRWWHELIELYRGIFPKDRWFCFQVFFWSYPSTLECIPLINSDHLSEFGTCYITGQLSVFRKEIATLCFHIHFLAFFVVFLYKICVFIIFIYLFDEIKFPQQIIIDKKLSMKLYVGNMQLL